MTDDKAQLSVDTAWQQSSVFKHPFVSWIVDLPLIYLKPSKFYRLRGGENSVLGAFTFCAGYTFAICFISLLAIAAKLGGVTPWRMTIYLPLFWVAVIAIRGCLLGLVIMAKTKTSFATAARQGFVIDSFSWISFFTFWLIANIWLFAVAQPPTTIGPYITVGIIGAACRLHGYLLDLIGLSTISGIHWVIAAVLTIVLDITSSIIIGILLFLIMRALFG
jgi:hypothetical protein